MNFQGIIGNFFPRPRRPVTLFSAIPAAALVALFLLAAVIASLDGLVLFAYPTAFWLLLVVPWFWWMHAAGYSGLSGTRSQVALLIRLLLVMLMVAVLAQPRSVRNNKSLAVVFVLDESASISPSAARDMMRYVLKVQGEKPEKDLAGLVVFGREAAVELPPQQSFPVDDFSNPVLTTTVDRDGTNIAKALSLASALIGDDQQGRIVLISDGVATEGHVEPMLDELKARKIPVDTLPVDYDIKHEVWVERLDLPPGVKKGETYEASVIVSALSPGKGQLAIEENGEQLPGMPMDIEYKAGKNRYVFPIYLREPGYYEYKAVVTVPKGEDGFARNNHAINYLYIKGQGKVLIVTNPDGDEREWKPLKAAIEKAKRLVEVRTAYDFPSDSMSLLPYDCIIFVNAPAEAFGPNKLEALKEAVYNQGAGFLMVGGDQSFGPGGYHNTPVEDALPVTMDIKNRKFMPKAALAIILHTCEFPDGNTIGKAITKQAIKILGAEDDVAALDYGPNGDEWIFKLTPASHYAQLAMMINAANPSDMPDFDHLLTMAYPDLQASDASAKKVIVISDGDPSPPQVPLVQKYVDAKITISTVSIHPHGGQAVQALANLAAAAGGNYYNPKDSAELPSIFVKETKTLKRSMIRNVTFTPLVQDNKTTDILKGIQYMPNLNGYVLTTPKPRATSILNAENRQEGQVEMDPVLITWQYGLGKTAAFTSDLSNNWGADWVNWRSYQPFIEQLLIHISRTQTDSHLQMQTMSVGDSGLIVVEDFDPKPAFLNLQAAVVGPDRQPKTVDLAQVGPRRYEGRFDLSGEGRYQVTAISRNPDRPDQVQGGFMVPYAQEYLRFRADPITMNEIAQRTDGRPLKGDETGKFIFDVPRVDRSNSQPIFDWFLILLACLVPLDVAVRRVQLDLGVVKGWLGIGRSAAPSEKTFSALLNRKQAVTTTLTDKLKKERPLEARPMDLPAAPSKIQPGKAPPPKPAAPDSSTTERLLALKKKRGEDPPPPPPP